MLYVLDCLYGILFSDYDKNMDNLVKFARRKVERSHFYAAAGTRRLDGLILQVGPFIIEDDSFVNHRASNRQSYLSIQLPAPFFKKMAHYALSGS